MKAHFELRITNEGKIQGIYEDGLDDLLGARILQVKRASKVEWEDHGEPYKKGWVVRSTINPDFAIRWVFPVTTAEKAKGTLPVFVPLRIHLSKEGDLVFFPSREEALSSEREHFWQIMGDE